MSRAFLMNKIIIAARIDGSDICCGTATEIASYAPEIKHSGKLHTAARGKQEHAYGWRCSYADDVADELEASAATCGPNLSAFF